MKLPEDEQKAYEHYKDDLHYQASMFESSFGDGYNEGEAVGIEIGIEKGLEQGIAQTTKTIALKPQLLLIEKERIIYVYQRLVRILCY